jgi:2-dehydro-3-deoxyphosphogluconate aldolase/(4S)-4-hydroxy-2-oxoglutarate aldolase
MPSTTLSSQRAIERIEAAKLIAVIRADSPEIAVRICHALYKGGVTVHEIALTTPNAPAAIEQALRELPEDCLVGAGTVLDVDSASAVIDAGASFVFAPNVNTEVITATVSRGVLAVPGALTPTEIATGLSAGAEMIKLFPATYFGPGYIKDIRGPLPGTKITPTGGINLDNALTWLEAGASALGIGSAITPKDRIAAGDWDAVSDCAAQYAQKVAGFER